MRRLSLSRLSFGLVLGLLGTLTISVPGFPPAAHALDRLDKDIGLRVCLPAYVDSFDPTAHRSRITQLVLKNIFESLTARDARGSTVPQLAESWKSIEPSTWELTLKKGVRFHNGDARTARDVQFTFERVMQPGGLDGRSSPRAELFEPIRGVEAIDEHTVRIKTSRPWPILPMMLSLQEIVPEGYMRSVGTEGFQEKPVGTGPFRFASTESGRRIVLTRFDGYHGAGKPCPTKEAGGTPVLKLIFEVVPRKIDQIRLLKRGETDIIFNVPPSAVEILTNTPGIRVLSQKATRSYFAEINCARAPFDDRQARQALNHAVDISGLVSHLLAGHGRALATILLPETFAYNDSLSPYKYDPALAARMLHAAGAPPGHPVLISFNDEDREIGNIMALFLTKTGLSARVRPSASYRPAKVGPEADWDVFVGSWGNSTLDPIDILPPKLGSDGPGNFSGYRNPEVDRLLDEAERAVEPAARAEAYRRVQAIIFEDAPMIFGFAADEFHGLRERVLNFTPSPTGLFPFADILIGPGG